MSDHTTDQALIAVLRAAAQDACSAQTLLDRTVQELSGRLGQPVQVQTGPEGAGACTLRLVPQGPVTTEEQHLLDLCAGHLELLLCQARRGDHLEHQARHDPLTGLLGRRAFMADLDAAQARFRPLTLALLDVQRFKQINDRYGHVEGDRVLMTLAHALDRLCPRPGRAYRLGGDEFALLLEPSSSPQALLERLHAALAWVQGPDGPGTLRVDLGAAPLRAGESATDWLIRADEAMYSAKRLLSSAAHPA
ncbi:GGDEF domain-containing protein [Deinococcus aquaedulcis]|uniref:GGDEF domain-containing protein n=1 Tax=Deinococcus aquaedulcis TaxID=2840455 RepID=UPI001C836B6F|nr:GGDEF domain-containing protein [Deinococcus aquaedulcis]